MPRLIDSSLWIDFTRARAPHALKQFIAKEILVPDACLAEPIVFEILRHATEQETRFIQRHFATLALLDTPPDLWQKAADLGQCCRRGAVTAGALDLLIACVAIHHQAELVTFDVGFQRIAQFSSLRVRWLERSAS